MQIDQRGPAREHHAAHALDALAQALAIAQADAFEMLDVQRGDVDEDGNPAFAKDLERGSQHAQHGVIGFDACKDHGELRTRQRFGLALGWPGGNCAATLWRCRAW